MMTLSFTSLRKVYSIEGPVGNPSTDGVRAKVIQVQEWREDTESDSE